MNLVRVKLLSDDAVKPERNTDGSVGYDIAASLKNDILINPGETILIGSGFAIELNQGYAAFIYARSGLGVKKGIIPANCVGVVDSDYRGEIKVGLKNTSTEPFIVHNKDRIAQMVITKCELPETVVCDTLNETCRGEDGFGSSGFTSK